MRGAARWGIRTKKSYAYYEDQMVNSVPSRPKPVTAPQFTRPRPEPTFSEQFYKSDMTQAMQFMQAKQVPVPPSDRSAPSYSEYLNRAFGGDEPGEAPDVRKEWTTEQQLNFAKKVEAESKRIAHITLNTPPKEFGEKHEQLIDAKQEKLESPGLSVPNYLDNEAIEREKEKLKATQPPPDLDEMPGRTKEEKQANWERAMRVWEEKDRFYRDPSVQYQQKHKEKGAPLITDWSRTDEASYRAARNTFMDDLLSRPGWTNENLASMYAAHRGNTKVGTFNTRELRNPEWQL